MRLPENQTNGSSHNGIMGTRGSRSLLSKKSSNRIGSRLSMPRFDLTELNKFCISKSKRISFELSSIQFA